MEKIQKNKKRKNDLASYKKLQKMDEFKEIEIWLQDFISSDGKQVYVFIQIMTHM